MLAALVVTYGIRILVKKDRVRIFFIFSKISNNHSFFLVLVMGKCEIHGNTYCFDSQLFWEEERFARTQAVAEKEMTQPEDLFS
jgi:hypothetical protein